MLLGGLALLTPSAFIGFFTYEFVEFCLKASKRTEGVENFLGDLCEFLLGLALTTLTLRAVI